MDMMRDVMTKMTHLCHEIKMKDEQSASMTKTIDRQNATINGLTTDINVLKQNMEFLKQNARDLVHENANNTQKFADERQLLFKKLNESESKLKSLGDELNGYKAYVTSTEKNKQQMNSKLQSLQTEYDAIKNNYLSMANEYEKDAKQLKEVLESKQLLIKAIQNAKEKSKNELIVSEREKKRLSDTNAMLQQKLKQTENANFDKGVKYEEIKQKNEQLNAINNELSEKIAKQSNELNEMKIKCENEAKNKLNINSEANEWKRKMEYYKKENEINKRRLLAFKYNHLTQEKLIKENPKRIGDEHQKIGTEVMNALKSDIDNIIDMRCQQFMSQTANSTKREINEMEDEMDKNRKRAKRLVHKLPEGKLLCALCEKTYNDTGTMQRHMNMKHMIVLNNNFDDVAFDPNLSLD